MSPKKKSLLFDIRPLIFSKKRVGMTRLNVFTSARETLGDQAKEGEKREGIIPKI